MVIGGSRTASTGSPVRSAMALVVVGVLIGGACTSDEVDPDPVEPVEVRDEIGDGEGEVSLLALAGYVEDGSSDPEFDWVTPFEETTGCDVQVRYVDSGQEMVSLLTRENSPYDGASVPGDAAGELISAREVAAVDPALFPSWPQILQPLRADTASHSAFAGLSS